MEDKKSDNELKFDKKAPMASYRQMLQFNTTKHKIYMWFGIITAILSGFTMPLFVIFLSDLYSSFGPDTPADEQYGMFYQA